MIIFHSFKLFHLTLFTAIYGYSRLLLVFFFVISPKATFGFFSLFHLRLFSTIISFFLLSYVIYGYYKLF